MVLIEFKWPIVLVRVMELPNCVWALAVSFSACEDFPKLQFLLKKNCWEHEGNIELKSCITEFWSSDKGKETSAMMSCRSAVLCCV